MPSSPKRIYTQSAARCCRMPDCCGLQSSLHCEQLQGFTAAKSWDSHRDKARNSQSTAPNTTWTNVSWQNKNRGQAEGNGFFSLSRLTDGSRGDEPVFPLSPTPLLLQEHALPSLLRPAKINTFITTLGFLILVAIVFHLSLSQVSSKILVELFISIFTAHLWQTEKIRCKEKL